ncbi:MAG: GGDEF domain-containing protein, partial [Aestuariivirgaceae bacterium]
MTVSILHILTENADTVLRSHAREAATSWASYFSEVTPNIESVMQEGKPAAAAIHKYNEASSINRIKRFTVLNALGRPVYTFRPQISGLSKPSSKATVANSQFINQQLVRQMTGTSSKKGRKPILNTAIAPIKKDGLAIGALHVVLDQSHLSSIFLEAAVAGGWEILILVNLVILACWFMYLILTRAAKNYNDQTNRTDELTGLPRRTGFIQQLDDALARGETGDRKTAVMVVKLDRFRELNDLLGHDGGDAVLREVAKRLREIAGHRGFVARLSGNTFGFT